MKKRTIIVIGIIYSIVVIGIIANIYVGITYNLNIFEYIEKSMPITEKEREILKSNGKIIYGSDQSSPPLRYKDKLDGQYKGMIVDLINALSIQIGQDIYFEPNDWWKESLYSLSNKSIDFFDLIESEERSKQFVFTDPVYTLRGNILKPKNSDIKNYEDLKGKKVAILEGDYSIEFLKNRISNLDIVFTKDIESAVKHLVNKDVEAVVGDEPVLKYYIKDMKISEEYTILKEPIYTKKAVLAVRKDKEELVSILNKGIFNLQKNGVYEDLKEKWYYEYDDINTIFCGTKSGYLMYLLVSIILITIYIFYGCTYILKKEIKIKTSEVLESQAKLEVTQAQMLRDHKMAAIGQLASGVAHEIRNPLGIIINYCYLLKEDDNSKEEFNEYIDGIENNVQRASNIVSNLLNFSRISSDKLEFVNIKNFLENTLKLEQKSINSKNIKLNIICEKDLNCYINEDSLKHVLLNLISNAIYAISNEGTIFINAYKESNKLNIEFKDTGSGISKENLKNIFNPFYTTKPVGKGTGLGLYITYNEITKCGGCISVESLLGVGTTFFIKIPIGKGD
ncbi:two-component sensor histidine kinase [[Clostridium] sordellii]|uniref:ATP-binding protein n=1 Tax=Paraclostridium sordellii TaxID=1505 RepID=UPI0005E1DB3D|nr:transporter substrate-binding domain-containing protein [Paeniclostridium sordellii]CEP50641.1 two-component sensor histidine kinase [[Clostridium] sordellii] [Paeniclostridium sordellii]